MLMSSQGEEVTNSHKVQSVRAVVEQSFADLKLAKVMESNKIGTVADFEEVLDCVIAPHNLRVLLKANPQYDIPERRAAISGDHTFKPLVPQNEVDLKIPADAPNLSLAAYRHIRDFKDFLPSAAERLPGRWICTETSAFFFLLSASVVKTFTMAPIASAESVRRASGHVDSEVPRGSVIQLRNTHWIFPNVARQCGDEQHL